MCAKHFSDFLWYFIGPAKANFTHWIHIKPFLIDYINTILARFNPETISVYSDFSRGFNVSSTYFFSIHMFPVPITTIPVTATIQK